MTDRQAMLKKVQIYAFALYELNLFLNTHPNDQAALGYYRKYQQLYNQAKNMYTMKYGPLDATSYTPDKTWSWIDTPWPWQYERMM